MYRVYLKPLTPDDIVEQAVVLSDTHLITPRILEFTNKVGQKIRRQHGNDIVLSMDPEMYLIFKLTIPEIHVKEVCWYIEDELI